MSIECLGTPTLKLTYVPPVKKGNREEVKVITAKWEGKATVKVKDEHNKKWRIGFVQLLNKNVMQAIYTKTKYSEILSAGYSMPILDAHDKDHSRPFYDHISSTPVDQRPVDVETSLATPEKIVTLKMYDQPVSPYDWWHDSDEDDPLQEFMMNLQFSTFLAARDITDPLHSGKNDPYVMKILYKWHVGLDRRYRFTVVKATGGGALRADLAKTKIEIKNPSVQPSVSTAARTWPQNHEAIFAGHIANDAFEDDKKPIKSRIIGEDIKRLRALFGN